jgi:hypothetical protein
MSVSFYGGCACGAIRYCSDSSLLSPRGPGAMQERSKLSLTKVSSSALRKVPEIAARRGV